MFKVPSILPSPSELNLNKNVTIPKQKGRTKTRGRRAKSPFIQRKESEDVDN